MQCFAKKRNKHTQNKYTEDKTKQSKTKKNKTDPKTWTYEERAHYELMMGDRNKPMPKNLKKYIQLEAEEEDNEGNVVTNDDNDDVNEFGVLKDFLANPKEKESDLDKQMRDELRRKLRKQDENFDQEIFEVTTIYSYHFLQIKKCRIFAICVLFFWECVFAVFFLHV